MLIVETMVIKNKFPFRITESKNRAIDPLDGSLLALEKTKGQVQSSLCRYFLPLFNFSIQSKYYSTFLGVDLRKSQRQLKLLEIENISN